MTILDVLHMSRVAWRMSSGELAEEIFQKFMSTCFTVSQKLALVVVFCSVQLNCLRVHIIKWYHSQKHHHTIF